MKRPIYKAFIICLTSLGLFMGSCGDEFLEIVPEDAATTGIFWQTPSDVQEALNGDYAALRSGSYMGGQGQFLNELMADHISQSAALANRDRAAHYTRATDIFM